MAQVLQRLRAIQQKLHQIKVSTQEDNLEETKAALQELFLQEASLIDIADEIDNATEQGQGLTNQTNQLLDKVVSEISRLMDIITDLGSEPVNLRRSEKGKKREKQRKKERKKPKTEKKTPSTKSSKLLDSAGVPEVDPEEIQLGEVIGRGSFGIVYKAEIARNIVAAKVPKKQNLTESELQNFRHEVGVMKRIYHQNVVLFIGASTQPNNFIILTELMETDVEKLLRPKDISKKQNISLYTKMKMAKDAALGMTWLHDISNVIHRDLKPANLLVDKNGTVKVTDFGFALTLKKMENIRTLPKGTALYMAPEVILQEAFNKTADTYSFGLILWEMLTEQILYPAYEEIQPFVEAVCYRHERPPVPEDCLPGLRDLMVRCWNPDKNSRPVFAKICDDLNSIIVDTVIYSESGRHFWKNYFLAGSHDLQEEINWQIFVDAISNELGVSPQDIYILEKVLCTSQYNQSIVSMSRFDMVQKWFGDFFQDKVIFKNMVEVINLAVCEIFLTRINIDTEFRIQCDIYYFCLDWFHLDISKDLAEKRLENRDEKTFLIRLSFNDPINTPFTISKNAIECNTLVQRHKRIERINQNYSPEFGNQFSVLVGSEKLDFLTLIDLVNKLIAIGNVGDSCPHSVLPRNSYGEAGYTNEH